MRRLYRSETNKVVGGVASGLGEYWGMDPLILRILFAISTLFNGVGVMAYLIMWVFVPTEDTADLKHENVMRHNVEEIGERARELGGEARDMFHGKWAEDQPTGRMLTIGGVLVGVGLLVLLSNLGLFHWFAIFDLWPVALIALGAVLLLNVLREHR